MSVLHSETQLLYVKSKAYLHPTSSKKDNVAGFLSLSRPGSSKSSKDILLSFTPESMLSGAELDVYNSVDLRADLLQNLSGLLLNDKAKSGNQGKKKDVVSKPPVLVTTSYAFSIPLLYVYLLLIRKPSLGWWFGSVIIHPKSEENLPVVFFHDDESPLTISRQKVKNQSFDPFGEDGTMYWGGQDFLSALSALITMERLNVEPSVYLVDPISADLVNFLPYGGGGPPKKGRAGSASSGSAPKAEPFKLPDVNKMFASAKWKVLETVATFTLRTKSLVKDIVDEHVPQSVVRLILTKPEVQKVSNDFESARVYLAKWAAQVKEEAEQLERKFMMEDAVYARINEQLGNDKQLLTPQEISNASRRKPVNLVEWKGFFDDQGHLVMTPDEVKNRIFHGGLAQDARKEAWPFLLGVYAWNSNTAEREITKKSLQSSYCDFKRRWADNDERRTEEFWKDQKVRIEKDVHRNDRNIDIYKSDKTKKGSKGDTSRKSLVLSNNLERVSSPETPDEDDDNWNLARIDNVHLFRLREILLTYNEYNVNLGYIQGMTDLLSPIYAVFQDEVMSFWAFAGFMERMERNFVRDQSGMKRQMQVLNELLQFMFPDLYKHLAKCESTDLFFFFRMLLVWYKREFKWDDVNTLWEVFWTDYYSSQYHLFFALAILSSQESAIKGYLNRFDEVLKYMNELLGTMKLHDLLVRAELIFLRFRRMVDLIDRENTLKREQGELYEVQIHPDLRELLLRKMIIQKEEERPEGVGGG
ncbi:hypothetical protein PUMCH_001431 [Australozyma saopauloensis]|uniref:Rab-GAP TBC domain-containing protein n=1 Tax=Australozyma saopauloensis TaxID=291208 RepID=A0AAX4H6T7_9ASCO|nr:hypothetical protein PUMCH_001431 [[Candida] saopauloensis]